MSQPIIPLHISRNVIYNEIYKDLHFKDYNFFGVAVGRTGAGKSGICTTMSITLDCGQSGETRFIIRCDNEGNPSIDTRVVYTVSNFLRFATTQTTMPKGSFVVWDEVGVENDNTQWFSLKSRITKYVMQTNRYLNRGVFMTVPDLESISVASKRLMHWVFDVVDRKENYCYVKPHIVSRDRVIKQKTYYPNPRYRDEYGRLMQVIGLNIPKPPESFELPYKKIKTFFTDRWYNIFDEELAKMKEYVHENRIGSGSELDSDLEKMGEKGQNINPLEVQNFIFSNLDLFKQSEDNRVSKFKVTNIYRGKGVLLPKSVLDEAVFNVNYELKKQRLK